MKCPQCGSTLSRKNGHRSGKQNYLCKSCGRQFLEPASVPPSQDRPASNGSKTASKFNDLPSVEQLLKLIDTDNQGSASVVTEKLLHIVADNWFESAVFQKVIQKIHQSTHLSDQSDQKISILLLDAENLKLDLKMETFLAGLCKYPLQVKIAFANWRNPTIGKQDVELYERGYQLVHVPGGKDSADAKMIALGACVLKQYRTVKEVFVCSGDGILTHLCNQLQSQGLTVYWVRRQNRILQVENRNTAEFNNYSLAMEAEIPSFEEVAQKIAELIKVEQATITERLSKLNTVNNLFQEQCKLMAAECLYSSPNTIQEPDDSAIGIESAQLTSAKGVKSHTANIPDTITVINIKSQEELEQVLINIIEAMKVKSPLEDVSIVNLSKKLQEITGEPPRTIVKKLKLGANFTKFLQSCSTFKLSNMGKSYAVAIAQK